MPPSAKPRTPAQTGTHPSDAPLAPCPNPMASRTDFQRANAPCGRKTLPKTLPTPTKPLINRGSPDTPHHFGQETVKKRSTFGPVSAGGGATRLMTQKWRRNCAVLVPKPRFHRPTPDRRGPTKAGKAVLLSCTDPSRPAGAVPIPAAQVWPWSSFITPLRIDLFISFQAHHDNVSGYISTFLPDLRQA